MFLLYHIWLGVKSFVYIGFYVVGGTRIELATSRPPDVRATAAPTPDIKMTIYNIWSGWSDLNRRPQRPERCALPTAPHPDVYILYHILHDWGDRSLVLLRKTKIWGVTSRACAWGLFLLRKNKRPLRMLKKESVNTFFLLVFLWSGWQDLNLRPRLPKSRALPTVLHPDAF